MSTPLVSIVIPCFNKEAYVGQAIQSALAQTYRNVEVIVIDDGSTDNSLRVVQSFGTAVRWETGSNRGPSWARNRGMALAQGDFIQFLDADDWLYPRKLEIQVAAARLDPSSVNYCDYELVGNPDQNKVVRHGPDIEDPVVLLARRSITVTTPLHWKRQLMEVGGFRVDLPCFEEDDLHLRMACAGISFRRLPEVLCVYRLVPGSNNARMDRLCFYGRLVYCSVYKRLLSTGTLTDERAFSLGQSVAWYGYRHLELGMILKAKVMFRRSERMHPGSILAATRTVCRGWIPSAAFRLGGPVCAYWTNRWLTFPQVVLRYLSRRLSRARRKGASGKT